MMTKAERDKKFARIETTTLGRGNLEFEVLVNKTIIRTFDIHEGQRAKDFVEGYNTSQRKML